MNFTSKAQIFNGRKRSNHLIWKIVGGAALMAVGVGLIANLSDIKRYIRISTM
jgi:hypothetical protein